MGVRNGSRRRKTDLLLWLYEHRCFWCSNPVRRETLDEVFAPSLDELLPRSRGGLQVLTNQVPAHRRCNMRRGNQIAPRSAVERHHAMLRDHGLLCDSPEL